MMTVKVGFEYLPAPIVALLQDSISSWVVHRHVFHVTEIIYCLRKAWYKRMHPDRVSWTTRSLWNVYRGSTFDSKWTPLFDVHQRNYRAKRNGIVITGTLDFVHDDGDGPILYDLKMPVNTRLKKVFGVGEAYKRQVQAYLALAHHNGELRDVRHARVLMVGADVILEDVPEWTDMLDAYLWPRACVLDAALCAGSPVSLLPAEEGWECEVDPEGDPYCPADPYFRKNCARIKRERKPVVYARVSPKREEPLSAEEKEMKEILF